jgi:predicted amidohydrolase
MLEHQFLKAGDKLGMCRIDIIRCGFMTCYEIRFPEISRSLSLDRAEILFITSAFPMSRLPH